MRIGELATASGAPLRSRLDRLADRARHLDPADCDPRQVCHLIGPDT